MKVCKYNKKLFPPNRIYPKSKCRSVERSEKINEESEALELYNNVNQLVDRLRELKNTNKSYVNRGKLLSILKELERLGVIEFDKSKIIVSHPTSKKITNPMTLSTMMTLKK